MRAHFVAVSITESKAIQTVNPQTAKLPAPTTSAIETSPQNRSSRRTGDDAPAASLWTLFKRIHSDERGGVSIETILIIAAIALPILIFIIKFGWPRIRTFFNEGMDELEGGALDAAGE